MTDGFGSMGRSLFGGASAESFSETLGIGTLLVPSRDFAVLARQPPSASNDGELMLHYTTFFQI